MDGDPDVPEVIAELLFDLDCEVRSAPSLREAIRVLQETSCDVLLCHQSELSHEALRDGIEELEPRPRLVVMSAAGIEPGAPDPCAILPKPFTRMRLLEAIAAG